MSLAPPSLNNYGKSSVRRKKSSSLRLQRAKDDHEAWLRKQGLAKDQIAAKRTGGRAKDIATPGYVYEPRRPKTSDTVGNGFRTGIMDKLHLEPEKVQKEILKKAARTEVAYNKGPVMYITDGTDITKLGAKSKR